MRILFLTDTHFTGKNPASRVDDIQEAIINKMQEVGEIIDRENIDIVLHGGDMFHTPDVSNQFTGKLAGIIRNYKANMYVVPGNHDIYGYNTNTIGNTKLGLLEKTGVIKIIDRSNPIVFNDNGFRICVEAQEYHGHIDEDMVEDFKITNINVDYSILLTHSMLLDHKFHEGIKHTLIQDVSTSADLVLAGHYHPGFKERELNGTWFFNPGGLLRVDASTEIVKSKPRVVIFDIEKGKFDYKYIELACAKDGKDVFTTKNIDKKIYNAGLESFHAKLKSKKFAGVNIFNLIDEYQQANSIELEVADFVKDKISDISTQSIDTGFKEAINNITIKKVELFNFQAHSHKVVDFEDGLNVIVGESNAGKTAIIRAIYWALYDKPSGSDFIKTGTKYAKVVLTLSNGYVIERRRTNSSSGTYKLISPDGTEQEFSGFSNAIPVEISNAHQMPEIKINGTTYRLNVATQLEAPFLIGNSPTERLSLLGALVDADRADIAKREIGTEKRRASTEKTQISNLKESKEVELAKYNYLDKLKNDIEILELAVGKLEGDEAKLNNMVNIKNELLKVQNNLFLITNALSNISIPDKRYIEEFKNKLDLLKEYQDINVNYINNANNLNVINNKLNSIPNLKEANDYLSALTDLINSLSVICDIRDKHINLNNEIKSDKYKFIIDTDKCKELLIELNTNLNNLSELKLVLEEYNSSITSLNSINVKYSALQDNIDKLVAEKTEKINSLQGVHQICEYCGSEIDINKMLGV